MTNLVYQPYQAMKIVFLTISLLLTTIGVGQDVPAAERQALVDLYNATDGPNWTNNTNWNTSAPVGDWFGVTVVDEQVRFLTLRVNQLNGSIPPSLANLTNLIVLRLSVNQLNGAIPSSLGGLTNLTSLELSSNQLSGTIPSELGGLTELTSLQLQNNQLSGGIPSTLGNLSALKSLQLGSNRLSGSIPSELGSLANLNELSLGGNQLSGSIPIALGDLSNLTSLLLANTQLSGSIPLEIGNLSNLGTIHLNNNLLDGSIPSSFGNLTNLFDLRLQNNQLSGIIPSEISNLSTLSSKLFFSGNRFVFSDFESEHGTYELNVDRYVYSPQLKPDIDETISVPENQSVTLTSTALTSPNNTYQWFKDGVAIPSAISKDLVISNASADDAGIYYLEATNSIVTDLTLTRNDITLNVTPPEDICGVSEIEIQALLDLYNSTNGDNWTNTLAGNQPWDTNIPVCDWFGVTVVDGKVMRLELIDNDLKGTLPANLNALVDLEYLNLRSNDLQGAIPKQFGDLLSLQDLNLSLNDLDGDVPSELGNLSNLIFLRLFSNNLTGSIPDSFSNLLNLRTLQLGNNEMTGAIPIWLGSMTKLSDLRLYLNNHTGAIPTELGNLTNLVFLQLYGNNLTGTIPSELGSLQNLRDLELWNNKLTGEIPNSLTNLSNLDYLNVFGNQLEGAIPDFSGIDFSNSIQIQRNNFHFDDFEGEHAHYLANVATYKYAPQAKVDLEENLSVPENGSITLTSTVLTSPNNTYQWFKDGVAIPGATSKDFVISSATPAEAGVYYFEATNSIVTNLTLTRNDITLTVTPLEDTCGVSEIEKQALLDLYESTDGDNWTNTLAGNQPWDTNIPVCDWSGVTVLNGSVTELKLPNNSLSGPIPTSIGDLSSLNYLDMGNNGLSGPIPSEISNLTELTRIDLYFNNLTGSIPHEIGQLSLLEWLNLETNELNGQIPSSLGNLTNMFWLKLNFNNLDGEIPIELFSLPSVENFNVRGNNLIGILPAQVSGLTRLKEIHLADNNFSGSIPADFANIVGLEKLYFNDNNFSGTIPSELATINSLNTFLFSNNQLHGAIPDFTDVAAVRFHKNKFVFSDFESDFLSYQTNVGPFFKYEPQAKVDEIETIEVPEGRSITLTSTALTSSNNTYQWFKDGVPLEGATSKDFIINDANAAVHAGVYHFLANNTVVAGLELERNPITLTVGPPLCGVSEPEKQALLDLYASTNGTNWSNTLEGNQPWNTNISVCDWFGVTVENGTVTALELPGNELNGTLPESIGDLLNATVINLGENGLTGEIPNSIGSILTLETLQLPNNNLTGDLPISLGSLANLVVLDLNNNSLESQIPISFCNLNKVTDLDLSFNELFGQVPLEIQLMTSLERLNLSHNRFEGGVPPALANLGNLQEVILNDNQFEGRIPFNASPSGVLEGLNIENNHFIFSDFHARHGQYETYLDNGYSYAPQAKTDNTESKSVTLGNSIVLTTELSPDIESTFKWFKDGIEIAGQTTHDLQIENATLEDAGSYYFTATNTEIAGLELERNPITLNVINSCDVPSTERQALVALYSATKGSNWKNTKEAQQPWGVFSANSLVCDWHGVTVTNNRITEIILPDNGLTGPLPNVFSALPNLETLIVSGNTLTGNISGLFDGSTNLQTVSLDNNAYIFKDIEAGFSSLSSRLGERFSYQPQAKVDANEALNAEQGSTITLTSDILTSSDNTYQWYKNGLVIPGATSKELVLSNVSADDSGGYHFSATNSTVEGLTLERQMIMLNIDSGPDACGVSDTERQVLITLYEAMDGFNWTENSGWNTDAPVCDWFGITTDADANVTGIDLPNNGLRGEIPATISRLADLVSLNLGQNSIIGEIPSTIGNLTRLETLNLNNNVLVGEIPESIGNATALMNLNLGLNRLSGAIPASIGNLGQLQTLDLNDNKLQKTIPSGLWSNTGLTRIDLSNNQLTGGVSDDIGNLTQLQEFWLANNGFSGQIPTTITNIPVLRSVRLNDNNFRDDLPLLIPDFDVPNTEVAIENNAFVFSDFEAEYPAYREQLDSFSYNPQADVDRRETIPVLEGEEITLGTEDLTSPNNSYVWYKNGSVIPGVTGSSYKISNFDPTEDVARYYFVATNSTIPVLELTRRDINLVERVLTPIQPLVFTSLCSENPASTREWRVRNPNAVDIPVTWEVPGTSQAGSLTAAPGDNFFTTQTIGGANTTKIYWNNEFGEEQNRIKASSGAACNPQVPCTDLLAEFADGGFESSNTASSQSRNSAFDAFGWTVSQGTPDIFSAPFTNGGDPYVRSAFMNSPNGGKCAGGLRVSNTTEAFSTTVRGLVQGITYIVEFYQANATNLLDARMAAETFGSWEVQFGSESLSSNSTAVSRERLRWRRSRLEFTASDAEQALEFKVASTAVDVANSYPVYMLVDGVRIYQKPANKYSTACYEIATQVICNRDSNNPPTISDLSAPQGTNVTWYGDPVGGTPYFATDELLPSQPILWADNGSDTRVALEILFDLGAPEGLEYQFFESNSNPTIADLEVEGTNITWHDSFTGSSQLSPSTALVDGGVYYAAQDGNSCRLAVSVNIGIPALSGNGFQEFCSTNEPTIANLDIAPSNASYSIIWYSDSLGGTAYNTTDELSDSTTYYAAQTDGTNVSENRFPVEVSVIDVDGLSRVYEQDVLFPSQSTINDLTQYFKLDTGAKWYDKAFRGTAYFDTTTLVEGNTYYARIGGGLCAGLKVLAVTVELEEDVVPELISCVKFVPQPGLEYVISGWVREETLTPQLAGTIEFNQDDPAKEAVLKLFNALTKTIVEDALEVPEQFVVKSFYPDIDMTAVLPYLKDYTGNNVTVYGFRLEKERFKGLERTVGYSFSLDPSGTNRMEYKTPEVTLSFSRLFASLPEFPRGFHFPLRNYDNLEIKHNSVSILPGDRLRINSDFTLDLSDDSNLKDTYTGYNTDGTSDSGIEGTAEIFDYLENPGVQAVNYDNTSIELEFKNEGGTDISLAVKESVFEPKGAVIDGWQRISSIFKIPADAAYMRINLKTDLDGVNAYFDDVRMHPKNSNLKSFVYDPITQRLQAELDENNYATFYEYDTEGGLVRVKKETERGIYTIQETRSGNSKLTSRR